MIFNGGSNKSLFDPENVEGTPEWLTRHQRRNRMKLEVWKDTYGELRIGIKELRAKEMGFTFVGTTELDIQEPKKKKLVHQYLFKRKNGKFEITTEHYYSLTNAIENLNPEYTVLHGIPETEKEIEV